MLTHLLPHRSTLVNKMTIYGQLNGLGWWIPFGGDMFVECNEQGVIQAYGKLAFIQKEFVTLSDLVPVKIYT